MTDYIDRSFDSFCDSIGFESEGGARDPVTSKARARFERQCDLFIIAFEDALEVISEVDGEAYAEELMHRVLTMPSSRADRAAKSRDDYEPHH